MNVNSKILFTLSIESLSDVFDEVDPNSLELRRTAVEVV